MKINILMRDTQYAEALALTLARCLNALVSIDGEDDADFVLCDELLHGICDSQSEDCACKYLAVSKFEPVSTVIDRIRAVALRGNDEGLPNVKAVAFTGLGGSGVSSVANMMAGLVARLWGKRVLLLSFNALGGPGEGFIYEALAKGRLDLTLLSAGPCGVIGAEDGMQAPRLNPLQRLGTSEVATLLSLIGASDAYDLIVIDIPLASSHWGLCMRVAETAVCVGDNEAAKVVRALYEEETKGLGRMLHFENIRDDGEPDIYGEAGARVRSFILQNGLAFDGVSSGSENARFYFR